MRRVDSKYSVDGDKIVKTLTGAEVPANEPLFLLRARDHNALPTLRAYQNICLQDMCLAEHIVGIENMIREFEKFEKENPHSMKQPGITRGL
jgi:hypothetical protein